MTPAEILLARWEAMSEPSRFTERVVEGLGGAVLTRTASSCHLSICSIWAEEPRKGKGTELLKRITDMADELGVFLEVVPHGNRP